MHRLRPPLSAPSHAWDHLPGFPKLGDISNGLNGHSRDEILDEIAKCELVCTNCHAIRTFQRAGWGTQSVSRA